jgi:hypothetical protein
MRNMFTHVVFRIRIPILSAMGSRSSSSDRKPSTKLPVPDVDIDRITDYGGVVGYTYGYGAAYRAMDNRIDLASALCRSSALALSSAAMLGQVAIGVKAELIRNLDDVFQSRRALPPENAKAARRSEFTTA